jgi:hypothetical protein
MRRIIQRTILGSVSLATLAVSAESHADTVISGKVENVTEAVVHLSGVDSKTVWIGSGGTYSITAAGASYHTIAAREANTVFTPAAVFEETDGAAIAGLNFVGAPTTAPTYKIAGTIGGNLAPGTIVTLNGANVGSAGTDGGGTYSFSDLAAGTYTVSASRQGHGFTKSRTITIIDRDSIENNFMSTPTFGDDAIKIAGVAQPPQATVGVAYTSSLLKSVSGGTGAYHYQTGTYATGTPPLGMVVGANGVLSGTPLKAGTYSFQLCAADDAGDVSSPCATSTITVRNQAAVAPVPVITPVPAPAPIPAPTSAASWVYYNGVFDWPGDYSFAASPDYTDTSGAPLSGAHDIKVTSSSWGGWLPYALNWKFNAAPYTSLTFSLKPTRSDQTWQVYFVKVGDIPVGIAIDVAQYGPQPVAGQWGTYTVPLAALGVAGTSIYKFAIQDQTGANDNTWYIDNVGFVN